MRPNPKVPPKFSDHFPYSAKTGKAAKVAITDVLAVKKGERVLIITNPMRDVQVLSQALYDAAYEKGAYPTVITQPRKTQKDFADPAVIAALEAKPQVAISMSNEKLGKDELHMKKPYKLEGKDYDHVWNYLQDSKQLRAFWSPSISQRMFEETVPIDYRQLRARCRKVADALTNARSVRTTTAKGMDLTIGLAGRKPKLDDGDFRTPGRGGNLPAGEVYESPQIGSTRGTIVYDGSISVEDGEIIIKRSIEVNFKKGYICSIEGGKEAERLRETIADAETRPLEMVKEGKLKPNAAKEYVKNARHLGELGFGLNPACRIVGNMLEDEKVYRTIHLAIGSNYDEDARALIHLDGLVKDPTVEITYAGGRKRLLMQEGELMTA